MSQILDIRAVAALQLLEFQVNMSHSSSLIFYMTPILFNCSTWFHAFTFLSRWELDWRAGAKVLLHEALVWPHVVASATKNGGPAIWRNAKAFTPVCLKGVREGGRWGPLLAAPDTPTTMRCPPPKNRELWEDPMEYSPRVSLELTLPIQHLG